MHDGKALQSGTSHYFGDGFARAFGIQYSDQNNDLQYAHQTSWGVSTRLIGALIMVHGDDSGLVLPPRIAPTEVALIPIAHHKEGVLDKARELRDIITEQFSVIMDDSDKMPGWKFSESEMKGIPVRIEIGPRDLENGEVTLFTRYNRVKVNVKLSDVKNNMDQVLKEIHEAMYQNAMNHLEKNTHIAHTYEEFKELIEKGGYVKMSISGQEAELLIKEETGATARVIVDEPLVTELCPITKQKAKQTIMFARAY